MADLQQGRMSWREDFTSPFDTTDTIVGRCNFLVTGGTVDSAGVNGGGADLATSSGAGDYALMYGPLNFEPDECTVAMMQARLSISDVSVTSMFAGFTDAITDTVIIEDEGGTLNTVPTDAFGILLEGPQDETYQTVGVQGDADNAQVFIGDGTNDTLVADQTDSNFHTIKIEGVPADNGTMRVYLSDVNDNLQLVATRTSFLDSSIVYAPVVSVDGRSAVTVVRLAELGWDGNKGAAFD